MPHHMKLRHAIVIAILVAGILLRFWIFSHLSRDLSVCSVDFGAFYAGGKLAGSLAMYSPDAVFAAQDRAMGCHKDYIIFIKPPFYGLIMWPVARLPFTTALWLWRILGLAALGVFLWLWPCDRLVAAAACAWFLPEASNFTAGQDVAFVLALVAGAYYCLKTGRPIAAGVLFGLGAIKFHLFMLLPCWCCGASCGEPLPPLPAPSLCCWESRWWPTAPVAWRPTGTLCVTRAGIRLSAIWTTSMACFTAIPSGSPRPLRLRSWCTSSIAEPR